MQLIAHMFFASKKRVVNIDYPLFRKLSDLALQFRKRFFDSVVSLGLLIAKTQEVASNHFKMLVRMHV